MRKIPSLLSIIVLGSALGFCALPSAWADSTGRQIPSHYDSLSPHVSDVQRTLVKTIAAAGAETNPQKRAQLLNDAFNRMSHSASDTPAPQTAIKRPSFVSPDAAPAAGHFINVQNIPSYNASDKSLSERFADNIH